MLFILNPKNPLHRVLRRGLVMGAFAFFGVVLTSALELAPAYTVLWTALGATLDKMSREFKKTE